MSIKNINEYYSSYYLESAFVEDAQKYLSSKEELRGVTERLKGASESYFEAKGEVLYRQTTGLEKYKAFLNRLWRDLGYEERAETIFPFIGENKAVVLGGLYMKGGQNYLALLEREEFDPGESEDKESLSTMEKSFDSKKFTTEENLIPAKFPSLLKAIQKIFSEENSPRWIICITGRSLFLLDKHSYSEGRYIEFDLEEAFGKKENKTFQQMAVLLHKSLLVADEEIIHDELENNSHKYAFGVTSKLQYAVREAIMILANDWARYRRSQGISLFKPTESEGRLLGATEITAERLKHEALVYIYRMLFCLYAESKEDSGLVPMNSSEYRRGYSFESLRDLELIPLGRTASGTYFHEHLKKTFSLMQTGFPYVELDTLGLETKLPFEIPPLTSTLFDPKESILLDNAKLSNEELQKVVVRLSLSDSKNEKGRGRINYADLGINQLGAVYEGILNYSAKFTSEDLIQVAEKGSKFSDPTVQTWFVPKTRRRDFETTEVEQTPAGDRVYPRGTFILYLSHVERERTASYYTPEVLTRCLVEESIEELLKNFQPKDADRILELKLCEPAMGSGAILNEAISQVAAKYLEFKQKELQTKIDPDKYQFELKRVKYYIATRNVYGVDLNPMAVELGSLSLWLGTQFSSTGSEELKSSNSPVPWFGLRLRNGNSLIGARRAVWKVQEIKEEKHLSGDSTPRLLKPGEKRGQDEVYHFLVFDPEMASIAGDKLYRQYYPMDAQALRTWRDRNCRLEWGSEELALALEISEKIDPLWEEYSRERMEALKETTPKTSVYPTPFSIASSPQLKEQEAIKARLERDSGAFQRLKLIMDIWCSLWFLGSVGSTGSPQAQGVGQGLGSPQAQGSGIQASSQAGRGVAKKKGTGAKKRASVRTAVVSETVGVVNDYPLLKLSRRVFLELSHLLVGGELSKESLEFLKMQTGVDFVEIQKEARREQIHTEKLGLFVHWIPTVKEIAESNRFHHWELVFPEILGPEPTHKGFDFIMGNPPWLKVKSLDAPLLNEMDPKLGVKKAKAADYNRAKPDLLYVHGMYFFSELIRYYGESTFLNSSRNYPLLKGVQTNLYKNFLVRSWDLLSSIGVGGLLHPTTVFDDPKGGELRKEYYKRLKKHFQFVNELKLFFDVGNSAKYSINIFTTYSNNVHYKSIFNLYHPKTILESKNLNFGNKKIPGIKNNSGGWELKGHPDRMIVFSSNELEVIYKVIGGSTIESTQLPQLHSKQFIQILEMLGDKDYRINNLLSSSFSTVMYDEAYSQIDGYLERVENPSFQSENPSELVLTGPLLYVGNPLYGTAYTQCTEKSSFDDIDLTLIPEKFLPRSPYKPLENSPFMASIGENRVDAKQYYRIAWRTMANISQERTLLAALISPQISHINGITSSFFVNQKINLVVLGTLQSLIVDYLFRFTGADNIRLSNIKNIPIIENDKINQLLINRTLRLNCLTVYYKELWEELSSGIEKDSFSLSDPRLTYESEHPWSALSGGKKPKWEWMSPLRSDFARRLALLEIDVLVAMGYGLSLEQLQLIYEIQFPVLQQYERVDEYDAKGRRLPNTARKDSGGTNLRTAREVRKEEIRSGLKKETDPITVKFFIDGNTREIEKTYYPPFTTINRTEEYEKIWNEFSKRLGIAS